MHGADGVVPSFVLAPLPGYLVLSEERLSASDEDAHEGPHSSPRADVDGLFSLGRSNSAALDTRCDLSPCNGDVAVLDPHARGLGSLVSTGFRPGETSRFVQR
jgi:hypothetical protein